MLVWATSEQFLPIGGTFEAILASESYWLQPMLVLLCTGGPHQHVWGLGMYILNKPETGKCHFEFNRRWTLNAWVRQFCTELVP
jgi:hypothetical protein